MIQTLLHADLFVMPNVPVEGDMEGFGLVALEASSCGLAERDKRQVRVRDYHIAFADAVRCERVCG